jgi:hypothetical protein
MMNRPSMMTSRTSYGGVSSSGSLGARGTRANPIHPLPSGSIASPVPALKTFDLPQSVLDGAVVVGGLIALVVVIGSLPLAIGLMIFGAF